MEKGTALGALTTIIDSLSTLDKETQKRTLQAVITYLDIQLPSPSVGYNPLWSMPTPKNSDMKEQVNNNEVSFSENRDMTAKDFLREKAPQTDIERIACLAYYLTYYRNLPHFKTLDLSSLNVEAAQPKFSNPTVAVDNATKAGLLVPATKGNKQISSAGEVFVQILPDRDAAKSSISAMRPKRRVKKMQSKDSELQNK